MSKPYGNSNDKLQIKYIKLNNKNYVDIAEDVIRQLKNDSEKNRRNKLVTTSKIRNILSINSAIYNDVICSTKDSLDEDIISRLNYLKVRCYYEAGREESVKRFIEASNLINHIEDINESKASYILFSRYLESLVAFRKYYGGKDE